MTATKALISKCIFIYCSYKRIHCTSDTQLYVYVEAEVNPQSMVYFWDFSMKKDTSQNSFHPLIAVNISPSGLD